MGRSVKEAIEKMARLINDQGLPPPLKTEKCCACGEPMMTQLMERAFFGNSYVLVEPGAEESTGKPLCCACAVPELRRRTGTKDAQ